MRRIITNVKPRRFKKYKKPLEWWEKIDKNFKVEFITTRNAIFHPMWDGNVIIKCQERYTVKIHVSKGLDLYDAVDCLITIGETCREKLSKGEFEEITKDENE